MLERLRRLEETVFGPSASPASVTQHDSQTAAPSSPALDRSNDLDYNNGGESVVSFIRFREPAPPPLSQELSLGPAQRFYILLASIDIP